MIDQLNSRKVIFAKLRDLPPITRKRRWSLLFIPSPVSLTRLDLAWSSLTCIHRELQMGSSTS